MKVECAQCRTGYEFDDALVSRRGTTVRCTGCGHVFRVRRDVAGGAPDRWWVRRRGGVVVEMETLRSLQRALSRGEVSGEDELVREGFAPRRIDTIAELSPFVRDKVSDGAGESGPRATWPDFGSAGEAAGGRVAPDAFPPDEAATERDASLDRGEVEAPSLPVALATLHAHTGRVADEGPNAVEALPGHDAEPHSAPLPTASSAPSAMTGGAAAAEGGGHRAPSSRRVSEHAAHGRVEPRHRTAPRAVRQRRSGRRMGVLVLAFVAAGAAAAVGARVTGRGLATGEGPSGVAAKSQPRVLVSRGEDALARGDLETAREVFERALRDAPDDERAAVGFFRASLRLADESWLAAFARGVAHGSSAPVAPEGLISGELSRARTIAAQAEPRSDVCPLLADALRVAGRGEEAARQVATCDPADPAARYARAVVALREAPPAVAAETASVLESVRGHAPDARRARAALVIALSMARDGERACRELDALAANPPSTDLMAALRGFCVDAGAALQAKSAAPDARVSEGAAADGGSGGTSNTSDPSARSAPPVTARDRVREARRATARGDVAAARSAYLAALDRAPEDPEALSGIADLAAREGDVAVAIDGYRRVVRSNPRYLPARVALADLLWSRGDIESASREYQDIVDRFAEASYPARVRARARGAADQE